MNIKIMRYVILPTITTVFIAWGCASTKVTSDWKDTSYQKKPGKVLVVALLNETTQQRLLEDELAGQLRAKGIEAVSGYTVLPEGKLPDKQFIASRMKETGADALFLTRLVDKKTVQEYVPGTPYYPPTAYWDWYDYYGRFYPPYAPGYATGGLPPGYPPGYTPGYTVENVYYIAEANLYEAATGKLVWSAVTESRINGNDRKAISSYVSQIINSLEKKDLIP